MKAITRAAMIFSLVVTAASQAQTWVKVANEGATVVAIAPVTVRYGSGAAWTAPQIMSGTFLAGNSLFGDPAPNVAKELDVQQTASSQSVTVNGAAVSVPALAVVTSPVTGQVTAPSPSTVTTKDQTIQTSAPAIPAGTTICTVPKNGGACKTSATITLAPLAATVPGQTAPIASAPRAIPFTCIGTPLPNSVQPDWTKPIICTVTQ